MKICINEPLLDLYVSDCLSIVTAILDPGSISDEAKEEISLRHSKGLNDNKDVFVGLVGRKR